MADAPDDDPAMRAYLAQLDLAHLELDEVQIEPEPVHTATDLVAWVQLTLLVGTLGLMAYFPTTVAYQRQGLGAWYLGCGGLIALALGLGVRRWVWARLRGLDWDPAAWADGLATALESLRVPPRTLRWLLLGGALSLMGLLVFALPHEADWQGRGYSGAWFFAVMAAIVAGILLGRWLVLQAAAAGDALPRAPIVLPPWAKWVTLATLLVGALVVMNGQALFGAESEGVAFGLGGGGLALGLGMALWLARRFDEMEQRAVAAAETAREEAIAAAIAAAAAEGQGTRAAGD